MCGVLQRGRCGLVEAEQIKERLCGVDWKDGAAFILVYLCTSQEYVTEFNGFDRCTRW